MGRVSNEQDTNGQVTHSTTSTRRLFPIPAGMLILALLLAAVLGGYWLGWYRSGEMSPSPVPVASAEDSTLEAVTPIIEETKEAVVTATLAVTATASAPSPTLTPPATETGATTLMPTEASVITHWVMTPLPTATPTAPATPTESLPTATTAEAAKIATAVAATLTAQPTPDLAAVATAEAETIATAVAATLTAQGTPALTLPLVTPIAETPEAGPAGCQDNSAFVADLTVPDNTVFPSGARFDKVWQVRNTGTCTWEAGYQLVFISGERMSAPEGQVITGTIGPGQTANITLTLAAPAAPKVYTGVWQLANPSGQPFGERLTVIIQLPGASTASQAPQAPKYAAPAVDFGYGIQAHLWDADMGPIVGAIQRLGFTWVKQQVPWKVMEPQKGNYQWGSADQIVNALTANGLKPMFSVVKAPDWARPPTTDLNVEGPPANPQDFADFLGALAAHYKGKVKAYEVWNEQNLHYEWGNEQLDPARYMTLLKAAYIAIKAVDPDAVVISGAPTPTGAPQPWAIDDYIYLEGMYQNGLKDACDVIGSHPSGYNVPPDADWQTWQRPGLFFSGPVNNRHHSWSFKATMEGYHNLSVKYNDPTKTIWPTEFGWATSPTPVQGYEYAADNSLEQQAEYTVKAYQMGKAWGWVGVMFLWNLNFRVVDPGSEKAQWGILNTNWDPMPVYSALAAMPK